MTAHAASHVYFGLNPMWVSTCILATTYAIIMSEQVNRAVIALAGAGIMIIVGVLGQEEAIKGVDWNTLGLLTGMMILVSVSRRSGMFEFVAVWSARAAKAHPGGIMILLQVATAVLSALLDNVTTVLLIVPVTIAITRTLKVPPYPYLFAEIMASNIGGTATLIGDPPNIIIGSQVGLTFNEFVYHLAPVIVLILAVQTVMIHVLWGKDLRATPKAEAEIMSMNPTDSIKDWLLLKQSLAVLGVVMTGFVLARELHLEPATIALTGAAILMLLDNWAHHSEKASHNIHSTFGDVEWITIFFFLGLFVVVHGVEVGGLLHLLATKLVSATGGSLPATGYAVLWASAFLSAIVDNIPFVATMIPLIKNMAPAFGGAENIAPLWWCLSLGACLGGNGTLIGASANLTVAGISDRLDRHLQRLYLVALFLSHLDLPTPLPEPPPLITGAGVRKAV
jgi:Na+/H+ antiporter NhaD/arsenite permease-like protein